ncbi:MAG: QueT transporter family protein [Limnochordia bacterium]|nr:QueT transporter family protein [Limnochordia bacterium]HOQ73203.1 QueT transporter family protein [Limnochordia bacterium]HPU64552.1 QueT transporter family protein [Limnochordia bacterium]HPZ79807.1 QueT transporter family protein [Limnochordia bacterium]HQE36867.1 QueT transporter family protein [Limnochordia bacterium]
MQRLTRAAIIAAAYIALVFAFQFASFGPIQFRVAEALTLLPMVYPEAIGGIYIGTLLANVLGGNGPWDIFGGSLVSLLAAYLTYRYRRHPVIPYASPIVLNAFLISLYLRFILEVPSYWLLVLSIGFGQSVVVLGLGIPLLRFIQRHQDRFL